MPVLQKVKDRHAISTGHFARRRMLHVGRNDWSFALPAALFRYRATLWPWANAMTINDERISDYVTNTYSPVLRLSISLFRISTYTHTVNELLTAVNELTSIMYRVLLAIDKVRIINFRLSLPFSLIFILRNDCRQHNISEEKHI